MHVAVIGAYGSAGVAVAERLSEATAAGPLDRLTLIDGGEPGGGLCILRGCMPSKEVLSAAEARYKTRHDDRLTGEVPTLDLERIVERKDGHIESFAAHRRAAVHRLADRPGVEFHHEDARFVGPHELELSSGDRLTPDYVVIATGSTVNRPTLPGIEAVEDRTLTSADVLNATSLPDSGVMMGFGYVGIELAAYLAEAGVDLTVIEHDERPLDAAPPAFGEELLEMYREEFDIEILTETYEQRLVPTDDGVRLETDRADDRASVEADRLFLFTGRRPNLDGLGVDATRLDPGQGWVDATMRARDDPTGRTYVVGDANGREPILHVAKEQGYLAADNILADVRAGGPSDSGESAVGDGGTTDGHARSDDHTTVDDTAPAAELAEYDPITHRVMFAGAGVYPYARVGHNASSAAAAGFDAVTVRRRAEDDGVFETKAAPRGLATLTVARDGTVLGYEGLHYHADAMAKTMQVIVETELDVRAVPDRAYHPTTPEILDGLFRAAKDELGE